MKLRRFRRLALLLAAVFCISAVSAAADSGKYVDEDGYTWDYDSGVLYDPSGSAVGEISNADNQALESEGGYTLNADGSLEVENGALGTPNSTGTSSPGLTQEEWEARMNKAIRANGEVTDTFYTDMQGKIHLVDVVYMGLGRSCVRLDGEEVLVPTFSLSWDTNAPKDKVLAVVSTTKQGHVTMRAKSSAKAFVMTQCQRCKVLRVLATGKNWTFVDDGGMRGYVLTSGLTFYANEPRAYTSGVISYKGNTASRNKIHLRDTNTSGSSQLEELPCGTPLTIFYRDDKWCEIDAGGWHCYILSEFVTHELPVFTAAGQIGAI